MSEVLDKSGYNGPQRKAPASETKVIVKFLRPFPPWQTGEVAGFPKSRAEILCKPIKRQLGGPVAELYIEGEQC